MTTKLRVITTGDVLRRRRVPSAPHAQVAYGFTPFMLADDVLGFTPTDGYDRHIDVVALNELPFTAKVVVNTLPAMSSIRSTEPSPQAWNSGRPWRLMSSARARATEACVSLAPTRWLKDSEPLLPLASVTLQVSPANGRPAAAMRGVAAKAAPSRRTITSTEPSASAE